MAKFKVNDEVVAWKNRGIKDKYYYGGTILEMPLNTKGKIIERHPDAEPTAYVIETHVEGQLTHWHVHEDEIRLPDYLMEILNKFPLLKEIEKHPVFEIAQQTPVFIIDEKIYSLGEEINRNKNHNDDKDDFKQNKKKVFFDGKTKFELNEIGTVKDIDELAMQRSENVIEKIQRSYCKDMKKDLFGSMDENYDLPQMIAKYVFPYLRKEDMKEKIIDLVETDDSKQNNKNQNKAKDNDLKEKYLLENIVNRTREKIKWKVDDIKAEQYFRHEEIIENKKNKQIDELLSGIEEKEAEMEMKEKNDAQQNPIKWCLTKVRKFYNWMMGKEEGENKGIIEENASILQKSAEEKNFAIIEGKVYAFSAYPQTNYAKINMNGGEFFLRKTTKTIKKIEDKYVFELSKKIRIDALEKEFSKEKIIEKIGDMNKELLGFRNTIEHSERDFGFMLDPHYEFIEKNKQTYFIYLEIPVFAIKSPYDENYYLFNRTRVGIPVNKDGNDLKYKGHFLILENNNHPFLHLAGGNNIVVCMGSNQFPTKGNDIGDIIAKRLRKAKHALMYGYLSNKNPAYNCDRLCWCKAHKMNHFEAHTKKLSELEKMGVPIISQDIFKQD